LRTVHAIVSPKTNAADNHKHERDTDLIRLKESDLYQGDPKRLRLLLEVQRIVNHNLPFEFLDFKETRILQELTSTKRFHEVIPAERVRPAIIELYTSTRNAVVEFLQSNRVQNMKGMSLVADFWTARAKATKFLGLRVYFVSSDWKMTSVLLGARHFNPEFSERDLGIRPALRRWILEIMQEFGLARDDLFGATTDAGPDVKWMMRTGLSLNWEWCIAHMTHAATKMAFGIVNSRSRSKNPDMTDVIKGVVKTVYLVRTVEVMGSLFASLCEFLGVGDSDRLLDYKPHRFLGLARVIARILDKWAPLVHWFDARIEKARRDGKPLPCPFPLLDKQNDLIQIMSLLQPIVVINRESQREDATQVSVLRLLYRARKTTLDSTKPLLDYRSTNSVVLYFMNDQLTPLVRTTRALLRDCFHTRFFSRYTDVTKFSTLPFVFEMQMVLDPSIRDPLLEIANVAALCNEQQNPCVVNADEIAASAVANVKKRLVAIMRSVAVQDSKAIEAAGAMARASYPREVSELFFAQENGPHRQSSRVKEELHRWLADPVHLSHQDRTKESPLAFWRRQSLVTNYQYLPTVARIIFAVPSSSGQIERDFGVAGMMVTGQRSSLSPQNIDMCSFLNLNRSFVDVTRCTPLPASELACNMPPTMRTDSLQTEIDTETNEEVIASFMQRLEDEPNEFDDEGRETAGNTELPIA